MESLFDRLKKSASCQMLAKKAQEGSSLLVEELKPSSKAYVTSLLQQATDKSVLILTGTGQEEFKLFHDLPFFGTKKLIELAAWETLPGENIAPSPDIVGARFQALEAISKAQEPVVVLSTLQGVLQKVISKKVFSTLFLQLKQGQKIAFEDLIDTLAKMGYERKSIAADKAEFAVRGGIIDIFPVTSSEPFRLEFWDNEIESIRAYDPVVQKSTTRTSAIEISAAKELELLSSNTNTLDTIFDYIGKNCLIVLDDLEALEDRYASLTSLGAGISKAFMGIEDFLDLIQNNQKLFFCKTAIETLSEVVVENKKVRFYSESQAPHQIQFEMFQRHFQAFRWQQSFESLGSYFERECFLSHEPEGDELLDSVLELQHKNQFYFIAQNETEEQTFKNKLGSRGIFDANTIHFMSGYLSSGFVLKDIAVVLFPMTELTHRIKIKREKQRTYYYSSSQDAFDILPQEMVVHFNHGIGKYLGVEKKPNVYGQEEEFFVIEYAEAAKLYVPLTQAHLISKYIGSGETLPKMHTLGTNRWKRLREQTEKAIVGYADELLKLYASRELKGGFSFLPDSPETSAFEEEFPYIETDDQLAAIEQVKQDMCSSKAMDRLVCGDVGYGKTEVAMRAAFKAVLDGKKQVAVLVPTTVLAMQHYETFLDRMESFGVKLAALSRFRTASQVKKIIQDIEKGHVDIVVGTHRLLQKDVHFKDLGLIIIDEEQRFGVRAKEHLKQLKVGVDCLTLSATPIPRTLYLSLVGAREISVINTPPQDRLPIKTVIADPDDLLIQTALLRELNRDGQAYFIHNRVDSIYETADRLKRLLPKARIVVGHGQMDADEIDLVFHTFKRGDADILVATSIIENGIDIANANTIIIDNADQFGIADLYQLRGRVGRWNRRAYAYFLIPRRRRLSEIAQKRIEAIAQAGGYGGGMKVAMRDLEMRGAGDILGIEQSGHVATIGFHLYCKLLRRTVDSMQGKAPSWTIDTRIDMPFDARLPESYVNDVALRMEIYQRLGDALTLEEVDQIWAEIRDRFGRPPELALWLYHQSRLRVYAAQRGYTLIKLDAFSLSWERKSGNKTSSNKVLIGKIKGPKELEEKIIKLL